MSVRQGLKAHRTVIDLCVSDDFLIDSLTKASRLCLDTLQTGNKLMLCGNGGSAADAQHIAAELVGRFRKNRPALPAIALTTDSSVLTAIGNDYDFEQLFSRQVQGIGQTGDTLIAISTSGNSPNVVRAAEMARDKGITVIGFSGGLGGNLDPFCDVMVKAPTSSTPRIQECHILFGHIVCQIIEETLFG